MWEGYRFLEDVLSLYEHSLLSRPADLGQLSLGHPPEESDVRQDREYGFRIGEWDKCLHRPQEPSKATPGRKPVREEDIQDISYAVARWTRKSGVRTATPPALRTF